MMSISSINVTNFSVDSAKPSLGTASAFQLLIKRIRNNFNEDVRAVHQNHCHLVQKFVNNKCNVFTKFLIKISFNGMDLSNIDLHGTDLSSLRMNRINLAGAKLQHTDFSHSKLKKAKLFYTNFTGADLYKANFHQAEICWANFSEANLRNADFSKADLYCAVLQQADLASADFSNANLSKADFCQANLSGANLSGTDLFNAELADANLDDTKLTDLCFPKWHDVEFSLTPGHISESLNFVKTVDGIKDKYNDKKIDLIHQLLDSLDNRSPVFSLSLIAEPLFNRLVKAPYNQDAKIINWLSDTIFPLYFAKYDITALTDHSSATLLNCFNNVPELMFSQNSDFIQLISQVITRDRRHKEYAKALYNRYLQDSRVAPYTNGDFGDYAGHADWSEKDANNFILLSAQKNSHYVMMMSANQLQQMLDGQLKKEAINWYGFYLYQGQQNISPADYQLDDLFRNHFKIFNSSYQFCQQQVKFGKLLTTLALGDELHTKFAAAIKLAAIKSEAEEIVVARKIEVRLAKEKLEQAIDANVSKAKVNGAKIELAAAKVRLATAEKQAGLVAQGIADDNNKMVSVGSHLKLKARFDNKFKPYTENGVTDYRLTDNYRQQLLQAYSLSSADKTTQAQTLLSLAAVFSKYSSSIIFGTESESPNSLRYFSCALMEQAHTLSPQVFKDEKQYKEWRDKLLGYNKEFNCTKVLSDTMVEHIKNHFPDILADIMPPAWS